MILVGSNSYGEPVAAIEDPIANRTNRIVVLEEDEISTTNVPFYIDVKDRISD